MEQQELSRNGDWGSGLERMAIGGQVLKYKIRNTIKGC
jgi:hypothetical protein